MKFILFVEGHTERKGVPAFLKRWLDARLEKSVGIDPVRFDGWPKMRGKLAKKAEMHLRRPERDQIIGVIGLLDLYGPTTYPPAARSAQERVAWATKELEGRVDDKRFRMFFAVHELEAWLLGDPRIFPGEVGRAIEKAVKDPESVDFDNHPSELLGRLYQQKTKGAYKKVTDGVNLLRKLDPEKAYDKCPHLRTMLDEMLKMAREFQE